MEKTIVIVVDSKKTIWGAGLDTESALVDAKRYADNTDKMEIRLVKTKVKALFLIGPDSLKDGECYE